MEILETLNGFDWLVVLIVGTAAAFGVMRGFIAEVASLAAWVAGFVAVRMLYAPARAVFVEASGSEMIGTLAAVLGPFLLAVLLVKLLGSFLSSSTRNSIIGPVDRLLGLGFGLVKGFLVASLGFLLLTLALKILPGEDDRPDWLVNARTAPTLALVASAMVNYAGDAWREQQTPKTTGKANPHAGLPGFDPDGEPMSDEGGYAPDDRRSLDSLLDQQEKSTPSTPI
ncbi:CvpA family protein [Sandarakinorhabdus sp.]|uniref:CvpA family protein n=1 Tax=Sandarakinorhabdus sp. TaxID=1916663 RepID=UPI003F6EAB16